MRLSFFAFLTLSVTLSLTLPAPLQAQFPGLTLPPSGNNQKAAVTQFIGPVKVTIEYSSPAVHGPVSSPELVDRRGKIWGALVPHGLTDLGFGHRKPSPWRAGANENTVFAVSHDVLIEGQRLPAGRYGLHMITGPVDSEWTLILSKDSAAWGSFFYEEGRDALRVKVKPRKHEYREYLAYDFVSRKAEEATVELQWEDLAVGWKVNVPEINSVYLSRLRGELHNSPGFNWQAWTQAVNFCLQINSNYEEALQWAEYAVSAPFVGQVNFTTLSTKAQVLSRLKREDEAAKLMMSAMEHPTATPTQIHQYGRQLLAAKKAKEAMEVFQINQKRNGDTWPVHVGLARGYAALGDNAKALEHAKKALPQAPDDLNRRGLEAMVKALSTGGTP